MTTVVDVVVVLTNIVGPDDQRRWQLKGRIASVQSRMTAEKALVGFEVVLHHQGSVLPGLPLRPGVLCRAALSLEKVNEALDQIAGGLDVETATVVFQPETIRPMAEPCARVPLSLLRELRGQESTTEMTRRALVKVWSEDRRTGDHKES
jgi:hypothetical protein